MSFRRLCACAVLMVLQGSVCGNKFDDLIAESTKANKRWTAIPTASPAATNRGTSWGCTLDDKAYVFGGLSSPPNASDPLALWELRSTLIYGEEFHMQWLYSHTVALMGEGGHGSDLRFCRDLRRCCAVDCCTEGGHDSGGAAWQRAHHLCVELPDPEIFSRRGCRERLA